MLSYAQVARTRTNRMSPRTNVPYPAIDPKISIPTLSRKIKPATKKILAHPTQPTPVVTAPCVPDNWSETTWTLTPDDDVYVPPCARFVPLPQVGTIGQPVVLRLPPAPGFPSTERRAGRNSRALTYAECVSGPVLPRTPDGVRDDGDGDSSSDSSAILTPSDGRSPSRWRHTRLPSFTSVPSPTRKATSNSLIVLAGAGSDVDVQGKDEDCTDEMGIDLQILVARLVAEADEHEDD